MLSIAEIIAKKKIDNLSKIQPEPPNELDYAIHSYSKVPVNPETAAQCLVLWIEDKVDFTNYKILAEWLEGYDWLPFPEKKAIDPKVAYQIFNHIVNIQGRVTRHDLYMVSFHCEIMQNFESPIWNRVAEILNKIR